MGSCCMPAAQDKDNKQPANKDQEVKEVRKSPKDNKDLSAKSTVANNKLSTILSTIGDRNAKQSTIEVVTSNVGSKICEAKSKAAAIQVKSTTSPKNLLGGSNKSKVELVNVTPFPKKERTVSPGIAALFKERVPKIKIVVDEEKILQNIKEKQARQEEVALIGRRGKGGKPATLNKSDMFKTPKTVKNPVSRP